MFETGAQQRRLAATGPADEPVGTVLAGLERLVDSLAAADLDAEPDAELRHAVVALQRLSDRLAAQQLRALTAVDRREAYAYDGAVTAASWLRGRTRLDHTQATRRVEAARRLQRLPRLAAALAAGAVTFDHATAVTSAARPHRIDALAQCEGVLVQLATRGQPQDVRRAVRMISDQTDPDGSDVPPLDAHGLDERRAVDVHPTIDRLVEARLLLDQMHGEALLTVIDAYDTPDAADTPPERRRTATQRRADALGAALLRLLDSGQVPSRQGRKPHVTLTVDLATLLDGHPHTSTGHDDLAALLAADPRNAALLASGKVTADAGATAPAPRPRPPRLRHTGDLDPRRARALAAAATVQAVLTLGPWRVVNVGRTHRTLPPWLRGALEAVHVHCRGPDCDRSFTWTDAHHVVAWSALGETDVNAILTVCRRHHAMVTTGGWHVTFDPDTGICTWTGPQGQVRRTRPQ